MGSNGHPDNRRVRVLVITGMGLNCEVETSRGFELCGATVDNLHISKLLDNPAKLLDYHILAMIGGFSFGDHIGAGVVYANRLRYRMFDELIEFIENEGLMLGICNGFQTMTKLGLVPAPDGHYGVQRASLTANDRLGYRDAWVRLRAEPKSPCVWTRGIEQIDLPARHGEGKFVMATDEQLVHLERSRLVALRYVDDDGSPTESWPHNPNGSAHGIAGVCDPSGRLFGLMPHPDAFLYGFHHPQWQQRKLDNELSEHGDGLKIFRNGVEYVARKLSS